MKRFFAAILTIVLIAGTPDALAAETATPDLPAGVRVHVVPRITPFMAERVSGFNGTYFTFEADDGMTAVYDKEGNFISSWRNVVFEQGSDSDMYRTVEDGDTYTGVTYYNRDGALNDSPYHRGTAFTGGLAVVQLVAEVPDYQVIDRAGRALCTFSLARDVYDFDWEFAGGYLKLGYGEGTVELLNCSTGERVTLPFSDFYGFDDTDLALVLVRDEEGDGAHYRRLNAAFEVVGPPMPYYPLWSEHGEGWFNVNGYAICAGEFRGEWNRSLYEIRDRDFALVLRPNDLDLLLYLNSDNRVLFVPQAVNDGLYSMDVLTGEVSRIWTGDVRPEFNVIYNDAFVLHRDPFSNPGGGLFALYDYLGNRVSPYCERVGLGGDGNCAFYVQDGQLMVVERVRETSDATRLGAVWALLSGTDWEDITDYAPLDKFYDCADLSEGDKKALTLAVERGILNGFADGSLRPVAPLSRAEFACMLYRAGTFGPDRDKYVDFGADYPDLADWNRAEIVWCMERGLMMGSGQEFGAAWPLTIQQVELVARRLKYGLTVMEKYTLLDVNGTSPIRMDLIQETARDARLDLPRELRWTEELVEDWYSQTLAIHFTELFNFSGRMDYREYQDAERYNHFSEQYYRKMAAIGANGISNTIFKSFLDAREGGYLIPNRLLSEVMANQMIRDSFLVIAQENCYSRMPAWTGFFTYRQNFGRGYEYFIYHACAAEGLPEGVELGKWYRRVVTIMHDMQYGNQNTMSHTIHLTYGPAELVPDELLNLPVRQS